MASRELVFLAAVLALAAVAPVWAQQADYIVINEVELNPLGDDAESIKEWVELYNPTDSDVYIGDWQISSGTAGKKSLTIAPGTFIEAGQHKSFQYVQLWFTDISETVSLYDPSGILIDQTPVLSDRQNDFYTWQRTVDGHDSDSESDWAFALATAGSHNGAPDLFVESEEITVTVSSDKPEYSFGETAHFEGRVSEKIFIERPSYQSAPVIMTITGPDYEQVTRSYPDRNLEYGSSLHLYEFLGMSAGTYRVTVQYADARAHTEITISEHSEAPPAMADDGAALSIAVDGSSYIPGDTVAVSASVTELVPFEGIRFRVSAPGGDTISEGTLYPDGAGRASTSVYLDTVSPVFGQYLVEASYGRHGDTATFNIEPDVREDTPISLSTDMPVYGPGDTVSVSGRLNGAWVASIEYTVEQTSTAGLGGTDRNALHRSDVLQTQGDGRFSDQFVIPDNPDRLGGYQIVARVDDEEARVYFAVSDDESFVPRPDDITIMTDMPLYSAGDTITISGNVGDMAQSSQHRVQNIVITFRTPEDQPIRSLHTDKMPSGLSKGYTEYSLSAVPGPGGDYRVTDTLHRAVFEPGQYHIMASYGDEHASTSFEIAQPDVVTGPFDVAINKDVFGLGETVVVDGTAGGRVDEVRITLTKPDGDTDEFGRLLDESKFSWEWRTPIAERKGIDPSNPRTLLHSVFGTYQVRLWTQADSHILYFKVSENPDQDMLTNQSLTVFTDKDEYRAGQTLTVSGNSQKRTADSGAAAQDRPNLVVQRADPPYETIYSVYAEPNIVGNYATEFALPVNVFDTGEYRVVAVHGNIRQNAPFSVSNEFAIGNQDESVSLDVFLDRDQYAPGQTMHMSGMLNKLISLDDVRIYIVAESDNAHICGQNICGATIHSIVAQISPVGSFDATYEIPSSAQGAYEVVYDTQFGRYYTPFEVRPITDAPRTIDEKFSRITDDSIMVGTEPKTIDDTTYEPKRIQGTLLGGADADLMISTGQQCIIGPDCPVSMQTHPEGQVYLLDGIPYNIQYSGPDSVPETFVISTEISDAPISESSWDIRVLKDDQRTKFYYKITYDSIK